MYELCFSYYLIVSIIRLKTTQVSFIPYKMTIETQSVSIGIPQYYNPNNEIKVIGALISILQNKTHLFQDERHKTKIWISSKEITRYINDRYSYIIRKNKKSINRRYDNKALSLFDKRLSEKNLET